MPCTPENIDALLPQTQCGLCGYGGCMPYATAVVNDKAPINLCPPGGTETLFALANLLEQDPTPYVSEMEKKAKPPSLAFIREAECIGCTKCIQACPVDAIIGSAKTMHTVLNEICTGCELCIPPCPVDCIDMIIPTTVTKVIDKHKASLSRERYLARQRRLENPEQRRAPLLETASQSLDAKKDFIKEALLRAKKKKAGPAVIARSAATKQL